VPDVRRFESELLGFVRSDYPGILEHVRSTGTVPDESDLNEAIEAFKHTFVKEDG
jgi:F-type H+-transporting ATPase subunit alpha